MPADLQVAATRELPSELLRQLRRFLEDACEGDFTAEDWQHALGGHHVWGYDGKGLVVHGSVVPRSLWCAGHVLRVGYVEAVATRADARRLGHGTALMKMVAGLVRARYALGALRSCCDAFYGDLGWEAWPGPTWVARPDQFGSYDAWRRTAEEDGGVRILRTPRTPALDPAGAIVCDERAGDVW